MFILIASQENFIEDSIQLVADLKQDLKENPIVIEICHENGFDVDILDGIPISFGEAETTAETVDGKIVLNKKILHDDLTLIKRYIVHELVHVFQHMEREGMPDPYKQYQYLERPDEQEAFQAQVAFEAEENGKDSADNYVDDLLEYHEIEEPKKVQLKEKLKEKIE